MNTIEERAKAAHPNNESLQTKWITAVNILRKSARGWVADGSIGYKIHSSGIEPAPKFADRVVLPLRRRTMCS